MLKYSKLKQENLDKLVLKAQLGEKVEVVDMTVGEATDFVLKYLKDGDIRCLELIPEDIRNNAEFMEFVLELAIKRKIYTETMEKYFGSELKKNAEFCSRYIELHVSRWSAYESTFIRNFDKKILKDKKFLIGEIEKPRFSAPKQNKDGIYYQDEDFSKKANIILALFMNARTAGVPISDKKVIKSAQAQALKCLENCMENNSIAYDLSGLIMTEVDDKVCKDKEIMTELVKVNPYVVRFVNEENLDENLLLESLRSIVDSKKFSILDSWAFVEDGTYKELQDENLINLIDNMIKLSELRKMEQKKSTIKKMEKLSDRIEMAFQQLSQVEVAEV